MKKILLLILVLGSLPAVAATRYVAASAGVFSGGTNCNGHTATTVATWNSVAQSADDINWVCGAITVGAGNNGLTPNGGGTSGHPVLINFDTGSSISSPHCGTASTNPTGGCVDIGSQWVVVDGKGVGIVQNTLDGTTGSTCSGGTCTANPSAGVYVGASNVTVQNLTIADIYDRDGGCSASFNEPQSFGIMFDSNAASALTNDNAFGNTIHDALNTIVYVVGTNMSNGTVSGNELSVASAEVVISCGSGAGSATNMKILNNNIHDNVRWWDLNDHDHLNGMHLFAAGSGGPLVNTTIAGNFIHGDFGGNTCGGAGSHTTALIYMETTGGGSGSGSMIYNNLTVSGINDGPSGGAIGVGDQNDDVQLYYNTIIGPPSSTGARIGMLLTATATIKGNLITQEGDAIQLNGAGPSQILAMDYNNFSSSTNWVDDQPRSSTFSLATWQAAHPSFDAHSFTTAPNLNATTFVPNSGSPVIIAGVNLTSLGIAGLDVDQVGNARPGSSPGTLWDIGALQFASGGSTVADPTCSPAAGTFTGTQSILLADTTPSATICYRTDGTAPTSSPAGTCGGGSTTFSSNVSVAFPGLTIKALGTLSGDTDSSVVSCPYTINLPAQPGFAPQIFVSSGGRRIGSSFATR